MLIASVPGKLGSEFTVAPGSLNVSVLHGMPVCGCAEVRMRGPRCVLVSRRSQTLQLLMAADG